MCLRNPVRCSACGRWSCPSSPPCAPPAAGEWRCTSTTNTPASSASPSSLAGACSKGASSPRGTWPRSARRRPASASWATPTACSGTAPGAGTELRRRLLAKEHDEHAVEAALERLAADGFLDDAAFARSYVADKRQLASWGVERIRRGLRELGVDSLVIDEALGGRQRRRRGRGRRARPRPRRPAPPWRAGATAGRGPPARLPGPSAPRLLVVGRVRRRAPVDRRRAAPRELTPRGGVTYYPSTRRLRVLCVFHFSLLHSDTDGATAPMKLNRSTRGHR